MKSSLVSFFLGVCFQINAQAPFHTILHAGGVPTIPNCVSAGTDSSFILAGHTEYTASPINPFQMFMAKIKTDGTPVFARSFDVAGNGNLDEIKKILPLPGGEFILIGLSYSSHIDHGAMVGRFSANGQPIWIRLFRDSSLQIRMFLQDGLIDAQNPNVLILAGYQNGKDWIVKLNLNGEVLEQKLIDCGPIEYSGSLYIVQMDADYVVVHPISCILNCGLLLYRITPTLGLESAKILPLADQPNLSVSSCLSGGGDKLVFTGSSSGIHMSYSLLGHLNWSSGNAFLRSLTLPIGFSNAATGIQIHPTKGLEYVVSGLASFGISRLGFALICDDSLRPFISNWSSPIQRIHNMTVSGMQQNNKFALAGIQDISNGNDQFRSFVNILSYEGNMVCGDTFELTHGISSYNTNDALVTILPLANTPSSLIQPDMTDYADWEQGCLSTSNQTTVPGGRVRLFPNPVEDVLQVENAPAGSRFYVTDALGREVYLNLIEGMADVKHLAPGMYYIKILHKTETQNHKWIKVSQN